MMAVFRPIRFSHNLSNHEITDMAAGHEFSIIVSKNNGMLIIYKLYS